MESPFSREYEVLSRAQDRIRENNIDDASYRDLALAYRKLLKQSEKIVRIGDATQNKLMRARRMLERGIQYYRSNAEIYQRKAEQKTELVGMLSHDMKNRAAPFRILIDSLLEEIENPSEEAKELLEMISTASDRMLASIDMALDRQPDNMGDIIPVFEAADVVGILNETIQDIRIASERKSIKIISELCDPFEAEVDPFLLGEIFQNVIGNAVKYSYPESSVRICLNQGVSSYDLIVEDQGQGFTEEDLEKAFQPNTTLSAKPTGNEKATGLGLSIVKRLVKLHSGEVNIKSDGKDKGALVCLKMPLKQS
jgi:signal transduction histidine kinase